MFFTNKKALGKKPKDAIYAWYHLDSSEKPTSCLL